MRDVAIVSFAQYNSPGEQQLNEVEMLMPVISAVRDRIGITKDRIGFVCSGSADYPAGVPFSFVTTLDAVGPWPPIAESHVDMDGAWALYEAWVKIQLGHVDTALVYAYGKSSPGDVRRTLTRQLDPYTLGPLWPDMHSIEAMAARALLESGRHSEADLAEVASRSRRAAKDNPHAVVSGDESPDELLARPTTYDPLRAHDCPPVTDGVAAVILAAGDTARELCERPAWIRGIDHRIDAHAIGVRDITSVPSAAIAAEKAGVADGSVDVAELHAPWSHQELLLTEALGLKGDVAVNPSGGALCANTVMAAGLIRMGEVAERIWAGTADRGVAHATSGPCLQQNLVSVLEGE